MLLETQFIESLARQSKFVQRHSKLTGGHFSTMMVFHNGNLSDTSLLGHCEEFMDISNESIKKQSLHERFNERAVQFFKLLLENVISKKIDQIGVWDLLPNQKRVLIKDSTSFQLPEHLKDIYPGSGGATSKSCVKIQFEYDLKTGEVTELSIGGFTTTDLTNSYDTIGLINDSDLLIRDLGYISLDFLEMIQKKSAFFLNRIKSNVSVWVKDETGLFEPIDLVKIEKRMRKYEIPHQEFDVYLGAKKQLECRLVIECLPPEVREKKLRRAHREARREGRTLGQDTISRVGLNLFVTNMSCEDLPLEHVWPLYRLRWQIELVFKVFKSVVGINKIKKVKQHRFECYLYGKLLWALLGWDVYWKVAQSISGEGKVISINKMMKSFRRFCSRIRLNNKDAMMQITDRLEGFIKNVFDNCMLEKRKRNVSSKIIIEQIYKI